MEKGNRPAIVTVLRGGPRGCSLLHLTSWRPQLLPESDFGREWEEDFWEGQVWFSSQGCRKSGRRQAGVGRVQFLTWWGPESGPVLSGGPPLGEGALATVPMCPALCSLNFTTRRSDRAPLHTTFEA